MLRSRISNLPFLDGATNMYMTTNKSHFKLADNTVILKPDIILQPVSPQFQRGEQKYLKNYQTETFRALSFPSHPPAPVVQPKLTHIFMHSTNFKLHSEDRDEDFQTTQSELKLLPMCAAKIIRPTTTVRTALPEGKYPETTYRSSYIKHQVSQIVRAKQPAKTGVRSSLIMDRRDRFRSSYQEQFQYRWFPRPPQSTEKEQMQYSSVVMGDQERTMDKQTTYSTSFRQSGDHSSADFKACLLPKINKSQFINLQEVLDDQWTTPSSGKFCAYKYEPDQMLTTMQKDFVPLNCRRQKMNPSQLQKDLEVQNSELEKRVRTAEIALSSSQDARTRAESAVQKVIEILDVKIYDLSDLRQNLAKLLEK